jgi:hypothetical protein
MQTCLKWRITNLLVFGAGLCCMFPGAASAQREARTGKITGTVVDAVTRTPLAGASIQVLGGAGTASDLEGKFVIHAVPIGTHELRASSVGYAAQIRTDIVVTLVRPVQVAFALNPVTIELGSIVVQPDYFSASSDASVSGREQSYEEIRRLPGGFEDVSRAMAIYPGVGQGDQGSNDLVVRGGAPTENLFLVDNLEVPNINHFGAVGTTGGPIPILNLDRRFRGSLWRQALLSSHDQSAEWPH